MTSSYAFLILTSALSASGPRRRYTSIGIRLKISLLNETGPRR